VNEKYKNELWRENDRTRSLQRDQKTKRKFRSMPWPMRDLIKTLRRPDRLGVCVRCLERKDSVHLPSTSGAVQKPNKGDTEKRENQRKEINSHALVPSSSSPQHGGVLPQLQVNPPCERSERCPVQVEFSAKSKMRLNSRKNH
jgi:hypothetical protein